MKDRIYVCHTYYHVYVACHIHMIVGVADIDPVLHKTLILICARIFSPSAFASSAVAPVVIT